MDASNGGSADARQSHAVPADAWEQPEMRAALAAREISAVYRLLRKHGVSQRQIAAMTGQSQSEVSEILKGRQVMAYDVLTRIADGLGVPRGYMGLAYDEATAIRVVGSADGQQAEEDESVKRRRFLAHAAQVTMGAAVFGPESGTWSAGPARTPAPGRIGMTDVRQVEAATRALRALDYQYGGGFCRDAVVAQLSWGQQMLESNGTDLVKNRLYVALADLHSLAGWTSFDTGLMDSARGHFANALDLAKQGENHPLVANVLYRMGRVYLHQDAPNDALKLFQLGQIAAQESGSELAVSVLCANEAWAYAMMGNEEQAVKLLGRSKDEFERANLAEAESWVKFFTETDVYAMVGTVHTVLAQKNAEHTKFAIPALTRAVDSYDDEMARSKTFMLSALATNHLLDGDLDHGSKVGGKAIDCAEGIKSERVKDRMRPLQEEAERRRNNADARDLADRLHAFYAA
ncbi:MULTISPECIES: helix-turn-helix transcriptional regulator [unclassified Amycolatopsis]|uniref:helix-turn-helix transcriptional regulator n=1 Tax=unclassified Amycolatopsis TaxID=2618356 RepID=UPI001FF3FDED|nr:MULTISPECIES: helix-turn-helix transcriptional regulator [unclassified Amycolatopsis]UOZ09085.1 helix-turn-helix transcriptional regulator [Amycolatopsis sp. WQ 127309]WSJ75340.1 helix-turn-helix transcriptional regulator [Amycolatopsis sp. NBC_01307]WSK81004.1 helix-turn-helix transcriptional regulator [Amycolatopsis sp. NBC_01286]